MKNSAIAASGLGLALLVGLALWWSGQRAAPTPDPVVPTEPATAPASAPPTAVAQAASQPAIQHPLDLPAAAASSAAKANATDIEAVLSEAFGRKSVLAMFQLDDFARRVVATVDNLGRAQASARLWPVNPAEGRFMTEKQGESEVISADNGLRYTPHVLLFEAVDLHQLVAAYRKLYPQLQAAYEDLGYPRRYFNDRVVEVLDQLIATPDVDAAPKVRLPAIRGPIQPQRPWVLYEFEDPALQSLSAGQRILLRTGQVNQRRLKVRLTELRQLLATDNTKQ